MPKRLYPKKAKLVTKREASFPRRNAQFWDTGDSFHRYVGATGGVMLQHGYMLDLKTGDIISPHVQRKEQLAHDEQMRKYYESHGMPDEAAKFVHGRRAKRRTSTWHRRGKPVASRVPLGSPLQRIKAQSNNDFPPVRNPGSVANPFDRPIFGLKIVVLRSF